MGLKSEEADEGVRVLGFRWFSGFSRRRNREGCVPLEGGVIMLDIRFIRENQATVEAGMKNRNADVDVAGLLALDDQRRSTW